MKKDRIIVLILILILLVGLSLLLYPTVSDYWNSLHQTRAIANYTEQVANLDDERYDALWAEAQTIRVTADALQIEPVIVAPLIAAPMLLILLIILLIPKRPRKKIGGEPHEKT